MKKHFVLFLCCLAVSGIYSCAGSKKATDGQTKEERKKEKEANQKAKELEMNKPPVQEKQKGPVQNKDRQTAPRLLENK